MKNIFCASVFCLTLFVLTNSFAQEQINVHSLTISQESRFATTKFDLRSVNSAGQPVNYLVQDATIFLGNVPFIQCTACRSPQLFNTNVFSNPISTQINSQSSIVINFYLDSSYSSPIYLGNLFFSRKRNFNVFGETRLKGKLEIVNLSAPPENRLIAFDNDVELVGQYSVGFFKPYLSPSGKKQTDFRNLQYSLTDSR